MVGSSVATVVVTVFVFAVFVDVILGKGYTLEQYVSAGSHCPTRAEATKAGIPPLQKELPAATIGIMAAIEPQDKSFWYNILYDEMIWQIWNVKDVKLGDVATVCDLAVIAMTFIPPCKSNTADKQHHSSELILSFIACRPHNVKLSSPQRLLILAVQKEAGLIYAYLRSAAPIPDVVLSYIGHNQANTRRTGLVAYASYRRLGSQRNSSEACAAELRVRLN